MLQTEAKELKLQSANISFSSIIGESKEIKQAIVLAQKVANTNTAVLLTGETGTGKEVFAQAIHKESPRKSKNFVAINCSTFSKEILETELFGYKAGAFTGAIKDKKGLFEEANEGTLFLDEIGEIPLDLQAKLLRVLETGSFIKVGDTKEIKVDVRILAATNRDLLEETEKGGFRLDLYYRLSVFQIKLPTLDQRKEDIPLLATFFLNYFSQRMPHKAVKISPDFLKALEVHHWKGNIRELKNVIERAIILTDGDELNVNSLPLEFNMHQNFGIVGAFEMSVIEKHHIQKVLSHTSGNKTEAARLLNIGLTTLYRKIEEYHLN
jgi:transcriptional regulator with PAS, ATPase and Fis domain